MYIKKVEIKNVRAIRDFSMEFAKPAGWHVLIGDNGSGKSTIIRSIALALVGRTQVQGLRANWNEWISQDSKELNILLGLEVNDKFDNFDPRPTDSLIDTSLIKISLPPDFVGERQFRVVPAVNILRGDKGFTSIWRSGDGRMEDHIAEPVEQIKFGYFSVAYGPYRRFEGGNRQWDELFSNPSFDRLAAHLSVFGEDVALTKTIDWLVGLYNISNDPSLDAERSESKSVLENLTSLLNDEDKESDFLPHNTKLQSINSKGVFFTDGNGVTIAVNQMSDGYRSILSLTFELIRQLVRVYGTELVFKNIATGKMFIDLPGVVLVDEIDAHLHPTWQTRIGQWFAKYFPQLQFIVTTHSPLVCRACERGSIWRLAAPGSEEKSGEITGTERDRLIFGNVLDAYGTEVFGANVTINPESVEKKEELVELNKKKMAGVIRPEEATQLEQLRKTFTTDDPIDL